MKIVTYDEFIKLPKGTMYCIVSPCIYGEPCIKEDNSSNDDWWYSMLTANPEFDCDIDTEAYQPMIKGINIPMDFDIIQRDGMFDYDRSFGIYSKEDIQNMINKLQTLI